MLCYYTFTEIPGCGFQRGNSAISYGVPFLMSLSVLGDAIPTEVAICSSNRQPITIQMLELFWRAALFYIIHVLLALVLPASQRHCTNTASPLSLRKVNVSTEGLVEQGSLPPTKRQKTAALGLRPSCARDKYSRVTFFPLFVQEFFRVRLGKRKYIW